MFGITMLDTAIGLIFVYLLLSLICSVLNEWFAALISRRPRNLVYGLRGLLDPRHLVDANNKKVVLFDPGSPDFPLKPGAAGGAFTDAAGSTVSLPVRDTDKNVEVVNANGQLIAKDSTGRDVKFPGGLNGYTRKQTYLDAGGTPVTLPVKDRLGYVLVDSEGNEVGDRWHNPFNKGGHSLVDGAGNPVGLPIKIGDAGVTDATGNVVKLPIRMPAAGGVVGDIIIAADGTIVALDSDPAGAKPVSLPCRRTSIFTSAPGAAVTLKPPFLDLAGRVVYSAEGEPVTLHAEALLNHPLIDALSHGERGAPSYIPAQPFALALFDLIAPSDGQTPQTLRTVRQSAEKLPQHLRKVLLPLIDDAGGDLKKAREKVENWYDQAMDRLTGVYKRWNMVILLCISFVVAAGLNADSWMLAKALYQNRTMRESVVAAADAYVKRSSAGTDSKPSASQPATPALRGQEKLKEPTSQAATQTPPEEKEKLMEPAPRLTTTPSPQEQITEIRKAMDDLHLPIGWRKPTTRPAQSDPVIGGADLMWPPRGTWDHLGWWIAKFFGLLFTAAALSLGAPFWFDTLNRFINFRSSIKTDDDTDNKAVRMKQKPPTSASGTTGGGGGHH